MSSWSSWLGLDRGSTKTSGKIAEGGEGELHPHHVYQDTIAKWRPNDPGRRRIDPKILKLPRQQIQRGHHEVMKNKTTLLTDAEVQYLLTNKAYRTPHCSHYFPKMIGMDPKTGTIYMQYLKHPWVTLDKYSRTLVTADPDNLEIFVKMMCRLARAVRCLHDQGIVHLDIKPENIFVRPDTGEIRLIDFGVACDREGKIRKCNIKGAFTRPYMPPQFFDKNGPTPTLDEEIFQSLTRRDLFALGVTLYESLYGKRPSQWVKQLQNGKNIQQKAYLNPRQRDIPGITPQDLRRRGVDPNKIQNFTKRRQAFQHAIQSSPGCAALVHWDKNLLAKKPSQRAMPKNDPSDNNKGKRTQRTGGGRPVKPF
jgi:serine/threonine protein kinase